MITIFFQLVNVIVIIAMFAKVICNCNVDMYNRNITDLEI